MAKTGRPSERILIGSLRAKVGRANTHRPPRSGSAGNVVVGIGDDCAVLNVPHGHQIVVTTDFSLENIHFHRDWHSPESIGHRCLARGLSDLAAMGANPLAAFLSLALPVELTRSRKQRKSWRDRFFDGFLALADTYRVPLAGGDTAESPEISSAKKRPRSQMSGLALADVVLVGAVPRGRALLRSGAQPGDGIFVTGQLGGAAAELEHLAKSVRRLQTNRNADANPHPHLFPQPRIGVGKWLVKNRRATAAIDISDGLSTDLDHLCEESGTSAVIDASMLPVHPLTLCASRGNRDIATKLALHGGEDYELLFTAAAHMRVSRQIAGVPVTCIGTMQRSSPRKPRMMLIEHGEDGREKEHPLIPKGWEHYR